MKYLIVDDEPIAHRIIEGYCQELPYLEKAGNAYTAFEASTLLTKQTVDLIFLDINMPKLTGFDWLKTLPHPPAVIVTTAYQEYALEGFNLNVADYLLKPFSFARFLQAINKVSPPKQATTTLPTEGDTGTKNLFIKGDKKFHQIFLGDILYVEAYGNYTKIHLREEMVLSHEKISDLETTLPGQTFLRVHKSFIVAIDKIKHIQGNVLHLQEQHQVPVGQTYRSRITALLKGK